MRWALLVVLVLVAGCLAPAKTTGPGPASGDGQAGDGDRTAREGGGAGAGDDPTGGHYALDFPLTVNPDAVPVAVGGVTSSNCVLFWDVKGADYAIPNGTATLTWTAATPLAANLALSVVDAQGSGPRQVSGPSPLVLQLKDLRLARNSWGLGFSADTPLGSAAVQQAVQLSLSFDYTGHLPAPGMGSCSNGL